MGADGTLMMEHSNGTVERYLPNGRRHPRLPHPFRKLTAAAVCRETTAVDGTCEAEACLAPRATPWGNPRLHGRMSLGASL